MEVKGAYLTIALSTLIFTQGCSAIHNQRISNQFHRPQNLRIFFDTLDQGVKSAKVQDTSNFEVKGFPYLRSDRLSVGLKERLATQIQKEYWVERMRQLDLAARKKEIQNLSNKEIKKITNQLNIKSNRETLLSRISFVSDELFTQDQQHPDYYQTVIKHVKDPSEYSLLMRTLGLYPLAAIPVTIGTLQAYKKFTRWHKQSFDDYQVKGKMTVYAPLNKNINSEQIITSIFKKVKKDPIGLILLDKNETQRVANELAPILFIDVVERYDKIGEITWNNQHVTLNTTKPTLYYYVTYAFIKNKPAIQFNYTWWYSKRSGPHAPWIEHGELDGTTLRITLNDQGQPLMMDVMNSCGCYHFFVPNKNIVKKIKTKRFAIDPFVPAWLPADYPNKALKLKINTGWHQVVNIEAQNNSQEGIPYQLVAYDELEQLKRENGQTESVFNQHGIMKDSSRIEPYIFFSAGIPKVGHMRQRAQHPIKLVGWAHFTDPDIFDQNFEFK